MKKPGRARNSRGRKTVAKRGGRWGPVDGAIVRRSARPIVCVYGLAIAASFGWVGPSQALLPSHHFSSSFAAYPVITNKATMLPQRTWLAALGPDVLQSGTGAASPAPSADEKSLAIAGRYLNSNRASQALPIYAKLATSTDPVIRESARYGQALSLVALNDPRAEGALQQFLKGFPKSSNFAGAAYQAGRIQYKAQRYQDASVSFDLAAAAIPSTQAAGLQRDREIRSGALYWSGSALQKIGKSSEAADRWAKELLEDPKHQIEYTGQALVSLASTDLLRKDIVSFQQHVEEAIKDFPGSQVVADELLQLGIDALHAHQVDQAAFLYRLLSEQCKIPETAATALVDLGIASLQTTPPHPETAITAFKSYLSKQPDGSLADRAYLDLGEAYEAAQVSGSAGSAAELARADLRSALAAYRQALGVTRDADLAAHAAWKVGALEGKLNDYSAALADLEAAIAKYPHSSYTDKMYFERARVLQNSRKYPESLAAFQTYLAKFPKAPDAAAAYFNLGVVEYNLAGAHLDSAARNPIKSQAAASLKLAQSGYASAAADFSLAINGNAAAPLELAYFYQGWAYLHSGQSQEAMRSFKSLINRYPTSVQAIQAQGRIGILEATSNTAEAIPFLVHYLASNPTGQDAAEANFALGEAYTTAGDWTHAQSVLTLALRGAAQSDQRAAAIYFLGRCAELQGNRDLARSQYETVIKQYPGAAAWVAKAKDSLARLPGSAQQPKPIGKH